MSVGLPGTGVGGLFYLVTALLMPFCEGYRAVTGAGDRRSRRTVARQAAITLGVLVGIWATGWLLGLMLSQSPVVVALVNGGRGPSVHFSNVLRTVSLLAAFATLGAVLGAVELARVVRSWARGRSAGALAVPPGNAERDAA